MSKLKKGDVISIDGKRFVVQRVTSAAVYIVSVNVPNGKPTIRFEYDVPVFEMEL